MWRWNRNSVWNNLMKYVWNHKHNAMFVFDINEWVYKMLKIQITTRNDSHGIKQPLSPIPVKFRLIFHRSLFLMVQSTKLQQWWNTSHRTHWGKHLTSNSTNKLWTVVHNFFVELDVRCFPLMHRLLSVCSKLWKGIPGYLCNLFFISYIRTEKIWISMLTLPH